IRRPGIFMTEKNRSVEPIRADRIAALRRVLDLEPSCVWARFRLSVELAELAENDEEDPSLAQRERDESRRLLFALAGEDPERLGPLSIEVVGRCAKLAGTGPDADALERRFSELSGSELSEFPSSRRIEGPLAVDPPVPLPFTPRGPTALPAASWHPAPQLRFATAGAVRWIDVGDVDHDLRDDVVAADSRGLLLLRQRSDGTFESRRIADVDATRVRIADLERLGAGDASLVVATPNGLVVLDPDAEGRWVEEVVGAVGGPCSEFEVLDIDGDGDLDVLAIRGGRVFAWRNDGYATLCDKVQDRDGRDTEWKTGPLRMANGSASLPKLADPVDWLAIEDFDGDRDVDVLVGGSASGTILLEYRKLGRFEAHPSAMTGLRSRAARRPQLADLDHDGAVDLLWLDAPVEWQRNRGDGTFDAPVDLPWLAPFAGANATLADVDRDGDFDLVAADPAQESGELVARLGSLLAPESRTLSVGGRAPAGEPPLFADLDQDADLDLVGVAARPASIELRAAAPDPSTHALHVELQRHALACDRGVVGVTVVARVGGHVTRQFASEDGIVLATGAAEWPDLVEIDWPRAVFIQWPRQFLLRDPERAHEERWNPLLLDLPGDEETVHVFRGDRSLQQIRGVFSLSDEESVSRDRFVRPFRLADGRMARVRSPLPSDRGPLIPRTLGGDWKLAPSTPGPFRFVWQEEMPSSGPPGPHGPYRRPPK
ncbi:MAG TPA: VCBS repeat-containing protein, partial [Planctomycetota bacterium]|nr:VCBS repeat-containing protein [Planctomycetota bacterium]